VGKKGGKSVGKRRCQGGQKENQVGLGKNVYKIMPCQWSKGKIRREGAKRPKECQKNQLQKTPTRKGGSKGFYRGKVEKKAS